MKNNYCSNILSQLTSAGYTVDKCQQEQCWQLRDNQAVVMQSRALGCLVKKAAHELKLNWGDV